MLITSIVPLDKRRCKVILDEDLALALYKGELRTWKLVEGGTLKKEQYREILETVLYKRARERALYLLKNSDKTEQDIRRKLREGFYPEEAVEKAVCFLKEYRYIDDENYARRYVETYSDRKSRRQIGYALQQKGISREVVSELLEETPVEEEQQIRRFLNKKHYDPEYADRKEVSRVAAALARKGYSFETIKKVMTENRDNDIF